MLLPVVVQAAAHRVRQPVVQSPSTLDIAVREFADLGDVVARLNDLSVALGPGIGKRTTGCRND